MTARWSDYDSDAARLTVAAGSREKKSNPQPLSPSAVAILDELTRVDGNPYIFVGAKPGEPLKNPTTAWHRVRERAGCPGLRIHDLRRTIATRAAAAGGSEYQIQQLLGHTTNIAARHYVHWARDVNRGLLEGLSAELSE